MSEKLSSEQLLKFKNTFEASLINRMEYLVSGMDTIVLYLLERANTELEIKANLDLIATKLGITKAEIDAKISECKGVQGEKL